MGLARTSTKLLKLSRRQRRLLRLVSDEIELLLTPLPRSLIDRLRGKLYVYDQDLSILNEGTEPA
jgi:hypothetical protein